MQGDLRTTSLEQLCRTLDERGATGELTMTHDPSTVKVWFREGRIVRATSSSHQMRLGDRLVHGGLISPDDLAVALQQQRSSGLPLGEVLVASGLINRHVVRVFAQEQVLDSLFAAVRWTEGDYAFAEALVPEAAVPSDLTVSQLLFALESRHRRWNEITRTIPGLDVIPEFVTGADPQAAALEPGEAAIVQAIGTGRSLEQIAEDLGFGPYEVATVVHGLAVLGLVRLDGDVAPSVEAAPEPRPAAEPAPMATTIEDADPSPAIFDLDDDLALELADLAEDLEASDDHEVEDIEEPVRLTAFVDAPEIADWAASPDATTAAPSFSADEDDDVSPWAFTIEGDDDSRDIETPRPRPATATPIAAAVGDLATGTPLPEQPASVDEPSDEEPMALLLKDLGALHLDEMADEASDDNDSSSDAEPPAPPEPPAAPHDAEPQGRPRSGDMSDLLRELRQLSGE